ncbi:MAG: hypothetical protein ABI361_00890 [Nitrososphaera sp.]|jgi:hypothetical protein
MLDDKDRKKTLTLLKQAIDSSLGGLGQSIERTINWHMSNKGVFTSMSDWDIDNFSTELAGLVGPGSEMILEDAADRFEKLSGLRLPKQNGISALERIKRIMRILGGDTVA